MERFALYVIKNYGQGFELVSFGFGSVESAKDFFNTTGLNLFSWGHMIVPHNSGETPPEKR